MRGLHAYALAAYRHYWSDCYKNIRKNQHFSALLDVCFDMKNPNKKYPSTEKTSKNPRNSA